MTAAEIVASVLALGFLALVLCAPIVCSFQRDPIDALNEELRRQREARRE